MTTVEKDITYHFSLSEITDPDYRMASAISTWLHDNIEDLKDDQDKELFGKVNYGYNDEALKTFGKKPVCDVYINNVEYDNDFENSKPVRVNTILIFYIKGANNHAYLKCSEIHDYLMQEFITNTTFKELDGIVKDTRIRNTELMNQPVNKKWGVMGALELSHILY